MTANIMDAMTTTFGRDLGAEASSYLGEAPSATTGMINTVLPALLGSMASKASTSSGAADLLSMLNTSSVDTRVLGNLSSLFSSGDQTSAMVTQGGALASRLIGGDHVNALANALSQKTGAKATSALSLLALIVPLVLAYLKRYVAENRLDAGGLASLLRGQRDYLERANLDSSVVKALGFGSLSSMLSGLGGTAAAAATRVGQSATQGARYAADVGTHATRSSFGRFWPLLIALLVLGALWSMMRNRADTVTDMPIAEVTRPVVPPVETPRAVTPPPAGDSRPVAPAIVDGLPATIYFDTASAALGDDSDGVLARAITAAKTGDASLAITGFTDRTGDPAVNEELAKNRAQAVANALIASGVPESRITMRPPMFITGAGSDTEARRVEITRID